MTIFIFLQVFFDAIFIFGFLVLIYFMIHRSDKKEETDLIQNLKIHDVKEDLKEMVNTMTELGQKTSNELQEKVEQAQQWMHELNFFMRKKSISTRGSDAPSFNRGREIHKKIKTVKPKKRFPKKPKPVATTAVDDKLKTLSTSKPIEKPSSSISSFTKPGKIAYDFPRVDMLGIPIKTIETIYRLADEKKEVFLIAKSVDLSVAEVQLILNLRSGHFTISN
jgi:hypothetical protein